MQVPQSDPMLPPNHILSDRWISELIFFTWTVAVFSSSPGTSFIHDNMILIKVSISRTKEHEISSVSLQVGRDVSMFGKKTFDPKIHRTKNHPERSYRNTLFAALARANAWQHALHFILRCPDEALRCCWQTLGRIGEGLVVGGCSLRFVGSSLIV